MSHATCSHLDLDLTHPASILPLIQPVSYHQSMIRQCVLLSFLVDRMMYFTLSKRTVFVIDRSDVQ